MLDIFQTEIRFAVAYPRFCWKMKQVPNCQKINPWQSSRAVFAVATWYLSQLWTKGLVTDVFLAVGPGQRSNATRGS